MKHRLQPPHLTRRNFLRLLAGGIAFNGVSRFLHATEKSPDAFTEVPPSLSGITWTHTAGKSSEKYLPESTGAGCAFIDYDNDGWMDIYLVNSGKCDFFNPKQPLRNALYHNNRNGTFTDVTEKAGVSGGGYGQGVAVGDYDNDGFPDLYVTQYGRSILYHNNGDGTFTDVTDKAGVSAPGWASSAVWFDFDNDGRLDLFVCRFVDFDKGKHHRCMAPQIPGIEGKAEYCYPKAYRPMPSWLFRNNGDGTFTDISDEAGIASNPSKAWGVVATDINNDGRMDLFVANDTIANFLFVNRNGRRFEEIGFTGGVALGSNGNARSGMGVDSADFNQDGWMDLFVSNLDHEGFSLYQNRGDETFDDKILASGVGSPTQLMSGWGLKFFDYDNDGDLDLMLANGHPDDLVDNLKPNVTYRERLLLFHNDGGKFTNVSPDSGAVFAKSFPARGLALGDFNNDGAVDVLVTNNDEAPVLLRNNLSVDHHWLGLTLIGKKANRDAVGARISYQAADLKRSRMKVGGGSYLSSHDPRIVLGIGKRTKFDWIEVKWPQPSGVVERFTNLPIDRYITLVEGLGKWT